MSKSTTSAADVVQFRRSIDQLLRGRIRDAIQVVHTAQEWLTAERAVCCNQLLGGNSSVRRPKRCCRLPHQLRRPQPGVGNQVSYVVEHWEDADYNIPAWLGGSEAFAEDGRAHRRVTLAA